MLSQSTRSIHESSLRSCSKLTWSKVSGMAVGNAACTSGKATGSRLGMRRCGGPITLWLELRKKKSWGEMKVGMWDNYMFFR